MAFALHSRLAADTFTIGELPVSSALLMNDSRFPWIILVPRIDNARDLIDLSDKDQVLLWREIDLTSRALQEYVKPDKLNVASLGNMVPQLHLHIIARHTSDAAWPAPVWGMGAAEPYSDDVAARWTATLAERLGISA